MRSENFNFKCQVKTDLTQESIHIKDLFVQKYNSLQKISLLTHRIDVGITRPIIKLLKNNFYLYSNNNKNLKS